MKAVLIVISILINNTLLLSLSKSHYQELESKFDSIAQGMTKLRGMSQNEKEYRKALFFESIAEIEESNSHKDGRAKREPNFFSLLNA